MDREETMDNLMEKIAELCVITGEIEKLQNDLGIKEKNTISAKGVEK